MKYNHRITETGAIALFIIFNLLFLWNIGKEVFILKENIFRNLIILFISIGFGYLLADFFSGFVHFLGDTFGSEETPILGKSFIFPFREHHTDPKAMTKHDFVETSGNNCIVSLPAMCFVFFGLPFTQNWFYFFLYSSFTFLMIFIFITNEIHKWAHLDNPPKFVQILQDKNIILNPDHHKIHHTAPYDKYFCITSGILNPFLYKIGFFEKIKKVFNK